MSGKSVTDTPKPFVEHADKVVKDITPLYRPVENVFIEPDDIEASPRIKDTLQIHMIKRFFDEQNVPYLQFFKRDTNKTLFSHSFMGKELEVIKRLLLMTTIVVHALETMNHLKNGFSAQDVKFGSIANVSFNDNR